MIPERLYEPKDERSCFLGAQDDVAIVVPRFSSSFPLLKSGIRRREMLVEHRQHLMTGSHHGVRRVTKIIDAISGMSCRVLLLLCRSQEQSLRDVITNPRGRTRSIVVSPEVGWVHLEPGDPFSALRPGSEWCFLFMG